MQNRAVKDLFTLLNQTFENPREQSSQLETLITAVKRDSARIPDIYKSKDDEGHFLTIAIANNWPQECITKLIQAGCDPNYHNDAKITPLIQAIKNDRIDCVTPLLELKANINFGKLENFTPLMWAITLDKEEFVRKLVEAKANINQKNDHGQSALRVAVGQGKRQIVPMLLENKADVNSKGIDGASVLYRASMLGNEDIVNLLLAAKASVSERNKELWAPIHSACYNGHEKILSALLAAKADVNSLEEESYTPLHFAAQNGHAALVPHLLSRKASLDQLTAGERTPLMLAAEMGHASIVAMLLEAKADPIKKNKYQKTAVNYAFDKGSYQCLQHLIQKMSYQDSKSVSPTLLLLDRFIKERVKTLDSAILDKFFLEADPTFPNGFCYLPPTLHCATLQLDLPKIKKLIEEKQVDADALDGRNLTAIEVLTEMDPNEIINKKTYLEIAKFLFDNTKRLYGRSLLHVAALSGNKAVLELFIKEFYSNNDEQLKKDLLLADHFGNRPLDYTTSDEARKYLLDLAKKYSISDSKPEFTCSKYYDDSEHVTLKDGKKYLSSGSELTGGFGSVVLLQPAQFRSSNPNLRLKTFHPEPVPATIRVNWQQEAELTNKISGFAALEGNKLIMRDLPGATLQKQLEFLTRASQKNLCKIADAIINTVRKKIHSKDIVHLDLNLTNILVVLSKPLDQKYEDDFEVSDVNIIDFGVSVPTNCLTKQLMVLNPDNFFCALPPECKLPAKANFEMDLYALGLSLISLFAAQHILTIQSSEDEDGYNKFIYFLRTASYAEKIKYLKPHFNRKNFEDSILDILCKMTAYDPKERPSWQSVQEFFAKLAGNKVAYNPTFFHAPAVPAAVHYSESSINTLSPDMLKKLREAIKTVPDDNVRLSKAYLKNKLNIDLGNRGGVVLMRENKDQAHSIWLVKKTEKSEMGRPAGKAKLLGEGGFGKVKVIVNVETGVEKAFKVFKHHDKTTLEGLYKTVANAELEAKNLGILKKGYPNVIKKLYFGLGKPGVVMDIVTGDDLWDLLNSKTTHTLSQEERINIFTDLLKEVQDLHKLGYLHLDLKSANIKYDISKKITSVLDLGTMCPIGSPCERMVITDGYFAPELESKNPTFSTAYDVYALAKIARNLFGFLHKYKNPDKKDEFIQRIEDPKACLQFTEEQRDFLQKIIDKMEAPDPKTRAPLESIISEMKSFPVGAPPVYVTQVPKRRYEKSRVGQMRR